jgi:hypothetical protein
MPFSDSGQWYPNLFDRQLEVFNSKARALLVCGPRKSGKTWAVLDKIIRHMWETPSARVAMFSRTLKNSKEGGTWSDLHTITLPQWIKSGIGLKYTTKTSEGKPGPKVDGQTRTPYFKIRNAHGGESELMLFSLDFDGDIEDKLKEQRFSMIYFSELSKFRDRKILSVALPSLRMPHLTMEEQMWLADTNPSEEGDASWIYEVWYVEKTLRYEDYCARNKEKGRTSMPESAFLNFQRGLQLIEIKPEENPYLDPRELEELKSTYGYDEGLYARYVNGLWVYGDGDASIHFKGKFHNRHIVGNTDSSSEDEWVCANPSPTCFELITGWDLGEVNHAQVTIEKDLSTGRASFVVLDEVESVGAEIDIATFTEAVMAQIDRLEETAGRKFDLGRAWSDRSSIEKFSATGGTFPYLEVYAASQERIFLVGVPKPRDSVRHRVRLLKTLLVSDRIHVSAHCKATIRMFQHLKKGASALDYVVRDENKHIFDALTYALLMECAEELEDLKSLGIGNVGKREKGWAVSIL